MLMASQTFLAKNGTKMTDVVHYALPLGFGRIMNTLVVKSKLEILHIEFLR
jgi:hypothetical protein